MAEAQGCVVWDGSQLMPDKDVSECRAALGMIREAIEELFGPAAGLESEEAVLLRGPEPIHEAEAIVATLRRLRQSHRTFL